MHLFLEAIRTPNWGPVSGWFTGIAVLISTAQWRLTKRQYALDNARRDRDEEDEFLRPARLVTFTTAVFESADRAGDVHVVMDITNDGDGPVLEPRPRVWLRDDPADEPEELPYTLCSPKEEAAVRIGAHTEGQLVLHVPVIGLGENDPISCTLEFTDLAGRRWHRAPGDQPVRLLGADAEVRPVVQYATHEEGRACAPQPRLQLTRGAT